MQDTSGFGLILELILSIIVIFISVVWLVFPFIVNGWFKRVHVTMQENAEGTKKLTQETARTNELLSIMIAQGKAAAASIEKKRTAPVPIADPPALVQTLAISKDGQNIGEYTFANVRQMLKSHQITLQDLYFDTATQEWIALELHPSLY